MIRRRLESYGGHVGNRLSVAVGVALVAGMMAAGTAAWGGTITSAGSGNWTVEATWVGGVAPRSADDVYICSGHTITNTGTSAISINSLTITGTLTHAANAATDANIINLQIAGDLTISSGGKIDVSGKGYSSATSGSGRSGGSHGGQGGAGYQTTALGATYDSIILCLAVTIADRMVAKAMVVGLLF